MTSYCADGYTSINDRISAIATRMRNHGFATRNDADLARMVPNGKQAGVDHDGNQWNHLGLLGCRAHLRQPHLKNDYLLSLRASLPLTCATDMRRGDLDALWTRQNHDLQMCALARARMGMRH
jgi:hypothetical protein